MSQGRKVGGGKDQFKWDDVVKDSQRGNYLGNSLYTSQVKSFSNPNPRALNFYLDETSKAEDKTAIQDEIAAQKQQEAEMMAKLLGIPPPVPRAPVASSSSGDLDERDERRDKERKKHKKSDSEHRHKHKHKHKSRHHRDGSPSSPRERSPDREHRRGRSPTRHRQDEEHRRQSDERGSPDRREDRKRRRSPSPLDRPDEESSKRAKYQ